MNDLVATLPLRLARSLAPVLGLRLLRFGAPTRPVALYWHARTHPDEAMRFFRALLLEVTAPEGAVASRGRRSRAR